MTNGRNLHVPGQVKVGFQFIPGDNAEPASITMTTGGQAKVMVAGGLTKLEHGALLVAVQTVPEGLDAAGVVSYMASVLNECRIRQESKENPEPTRTGGA